MVKIDNYVYGCITINKKDYKDDVYITANGAVAMRKHTLEGKSHLLVTEEEMKFLLKEEPEVIIIGAGKKGLLKVAKEAQDLCKKNNIKLEILDSVKAHNRFDWYSNNKQKIAGLFHLTD